jgi:hypothetical protein
MKFYFAIRTGLPLANRLDRRQMSRTDPPDY